MTIACVTGGRGLVGRHIVSLLLAAGYQVRVLVRSMPAEPVAGVDYHLGDLSDRASLSAFLASGKMLFHCAAELNDTALMELVNVQGTKNLAQGYNELDFDYFCFISSAGVVGLTEKSVVMESDMCRPRNPYEASKLAAEALLREAVSADSLVMLRPTNVVDNQKPGLLRESLQSGFYSKVKFFLKGAESAHLVHAHDVARAALSFINTPRRGECYFVSRDEDPENYVLKVRRLVRAGALNATSSVLIALPAIVPYWIRCLLLKKSNRGDVVYSSKKLESTGFTYVYSVREMVRDFLTAKSVKS